MRAVYVLITFFLLLCVFFTRWYLCEVRGLCDLVPALEILAMILMAFLIGFAGSWLLSEKTFRLVRGQLGRAERSNTMLNEQINLVEKENESVRKQMADWQREVALVTQQKSLQAQNRLSQIEQELYQYQRRYENLKSESDSVRDAASQLRNELAEERLRVSRLKSQLEEKPAETPKPAAHSRFTPSTSQVKSDLTKISGIGPVIQKRLNDIGIYSYQQIAALTPEMVDRVAAAIKFFPDRIGRDNWIGQAAALMKVKKKVK